MILANKQNKNEAVQRNARRLPKSPLWFNDRIPQADSLKTVSRKH